MRASRIIATGTNAILLVVARYRRRARAPLLLVKYNEDYLQSFRRRVHSNYSHRP